MCRKPTTQSLRAELQGDERPTAQRGEMAHKPLEFLYERFGHYIEDRRRQPRNDVMTELATATFPDGTLPPVNDIMLIASNLFAAGGETTARLLGTMLRNVADRPELQQQLRDERHLHPGLRRGDAAARDARCTRSSDWRASRRRSAASSCPRAPR